MSGTIFKNANLQNSDISGTNLLGSNLENAQLNDALLIRTYLSHANLDHTNLNSADLSGADLTGISINTTEVVGARFTQNIGMSQEIKSQLRDNGAIFFTPYTTIQDINSDNSNQKDYFRIVRRVDEIKADLKYRHLDLEEAWRIFQYANKTFKLTLNEYLEHKYLKDEQVDIIENWLLHIEQDLDKSNQTIETNRIDLDNMLHNSGNKDLLEWIEESLLDELNSIHEAIVKLNSHTGLVYTVWKSLAKD